MAQKSESRTNGPHVSAKEGPRNIEDQDRWSDENQRREPAAESEDNGSRPIGQIVRRLPLSAVMTGFGLGVGFGLGLTLLLSRRKQTWIERNVPESIQHFPEQLKRVPDSLGAYVPTSWKHW
jgi:hypothetical protein